MPRYFLLNKPYNMVSQFVSPDKVNLLGEIDFEFPEGTHAVGRLDNHSEGLLILTTDKSVTKKLFEPGKQHQRQYLVMVQNEVNENSLQQLRNGIPIKIKNAVSYIAKPISVEIIKDAASLYPFSIDPREQYPHTWLLITLTEGKYRQVRKMVLSIRHRCLRLVRLSIVNLKLDGIAPGKLLELSQDDFYQLAGIPKNKNEK